jgi:hypothetical protein
VLHEFSYSYFISVDGLWIWEFGGTLKTDLEVLAGSFIWGHVHSISALCV